MEAVEKTNLQLLEERIAEFAAAVKKPVDEVKAKIIGIIGELDDTSIDVISDEESTTTNDLKEALVGELKVPVALFRKNLVILRGPKVEVAVAEGEAMGKIIGADLLPQVPDDDSFIAALKTTGELRKGITPIDVQSACKAVIADGVGLFDLPDKILERMEDVATRTKKPFTTAYYELETLIAKRSYAEVLKAIGVDSRYVGQKKKDECIRLGRATLWPTLRDFHVQLSAWREAYRDSANDPRALIAAVKGRDITEIPDTGPVRDAAEGVIDKVNEMFAGPGIPVFRAIAYDATNIKKTLQDDRLPASVGATDYEEMLELLGATVTADVVRQEQNVVKYTLGIMELKKVTPGQTEADYILALWQVGQTILFDKFLGGAAAAAKVGGSEKPFRKF
jgi:hypothetical protein